MPWAQSDAKEADKAGPRGTFSLASSSWESLRYTLFCISLSLLLLNLSSLNVRVGGGINNPLLFVHFIVPFF